MPGRIEFDFSFSRVRTTGPRPAEGDPFRIAILGDFGARRSGPAAPAGGVKVDVDNFEQVLRTASPSLVLPGEAGATVQFRSLEDFHPDGLLARVPALQRLGALRARLRDPRTFAEAAAELAAPTLAPAPEVVPQGASSPAKESEDTDDTLRRLLGAPAGQAASGAVTGNAIDAWIRRVVEPHVEPDAPRFQPQYVAAVERTMSDALRALLHEPALQALESAWRGLYWLVTSVPGTVEIRLFDLPRAELEANFAAAGGDPERTDLYRRLVRDGEGGIDAPRWSLIAGLYRFGASAEDAHALGLAGAIAARAGAAFVAEADCSLLGVTSLAAAADPGSWQAPQGEAGEAWQALRASTVAPWIGLALPRLLLRQPYGAKSDPVAGLAFEELDASPQHEHYLWGNAALGCALLLAQSFAEREWEMEPGDCIELADLPAHVVERDGEKAMQACAELYLSQSAGDALLGRGLMPFMSYRNRNAVRLLRMQSIAHPPAALRGPWG